MNEMITRLIETGAAQTGARRRDPNRARRCYVQDAKTLLQQRFRERLRLDDVARALHVSTFHLCRLFKEETGMPIHRYLNHLRLRYALRELVQGETELAELAMAVGFSCQSHFTTAFRKEFGVSPGEARRRARDRHLIPT
jgi:AraC family transcriptional regulator